MNLRLDPHVVRFEQAAEIFCAEVESNRTDEEWPMRMVDALAQVYAAAYRLPDVDIEDDTPNIPDEYEIEHSEWRALFERLQVRFGRHDSHWAYFDPTEPVDSDEKPTIHSLADDLADIYRDLMPGIRAWRSGRDELLPSVACGWRFPLFGSHWGVHAVSALRALHSLAHLRGVEDPAQPTARPDNAG